MNTFLQCVTLEVDDLPAAERFYADAFGIGPRVRLRTSEVPTRGFRAFTLSLVVSQPAAVDGFVRAALEAGATSLKSPVKQFWGGYSGILRAPDGTIWKVATSSKRNTGPASREIDEIYLLLGVEDFIASKRFYLEHGLEVKKSIARAYVEFAAASEHIKLGLYKRRALAKDAGVSPDGSGSHRLAIASEAGPFIDPDGFAWELPVSESGRVAS
jgi:predicted lactoylglutathione lyase